MNQNIKLIIIIIVILLTSFIYNKIKPSKKIVDLKKEMIYSSGGNETTKNGKVNVNEAKVEDYLKVGITMSLAEKIVDYKETVGRIEKLENLERMSGVGEKTIKKLAPKIEVGIGGKVKKLKINKASVKVLKYYGFTTKEVKELEKYKKKNEVIYSNIELMEIIGEERYRKYENIVDYN